MFSVCLPPTRASSRWNAPILQFSIRWRKHFFNLGCIVSRGAVKDGEWVLTQDSSVPVIKLTSNDDNMLGVPSFPTVNSPQRLSSSSSGDNEQRGSRTKVALKPGRSLMHWIKLANGPKDIQGFNGRTFPVSLEELAKHNNVNDCWIAIRGIYRLLFSSIIIVTECHMLYACLSLLGLASGSNIFKEMLLFFYVVLRYSHRLKVTWLSNVWETFEGKHSLFTSQTLAS